MAKLNIKKQRRIRQRRDTSTVKRFGSYTDKAIQEYDLETQWPPEVTSEVEGIAGSANDYDQFHCLDFTHLPFITIDAVNARDCDDAIYARKIVDGWLLQIAIADVSHYVRPGMSVDEAAASRGNSTYFVDRVIPMLPEALSNDLCSLRPDENRLAIVCSISIDSSGNFLDWTFDQAWIRSRCRLTYGEVDRYLEKREAQFHRSWGRAVCESLDMASQVVLARRNLGADTNRIDISLPEAEITLGDNGTVVAIHYREDNRATKVIEECMLSANLCAAQTLEKTLNRAIYRVHQAPTLCDIEGLRQVLQRFGFTLSGGPSPKIRDFNQTLNVAREALETVRWLEGLILRTLKQARYDSTVGPHFALGFNCYTHFTSPIRRYSDLVVHRLIKHIYGYDSSVHIDVADDELADVGMHCSMTERRSEGAERAVIACHKAQFMLEKIGQVFKVSISGVTEFGVFVQLLDQPIDGLVHVSQLGNDYYEFNPKAVELVGTHTGKTYRLGDTLEVILTGASPDEGKISFSGIMDNQSTRRRNTRRRGRKTYRQ